MSEDGKAAPGDLIIIDRVLERTQRVVEPELDMNRLRPRQRSGFEQLRQWLRQMLFGVGGTRSPMRSIGRELEEVWPSGER